MLLLWANDQEIESVIQLLVKLGELPPQSGNLEKVRVLTTIAPEDAADFLENLRRAWKSLLPNDLNLPEAKEQTPGDDPDQPNPSLPAGASKEVRSAYSHRRGQLLKVALLGSAASRVVEDDRQQLAEPAVNDSVVTDPVTKKPADQPARQTEEDRAFATPLGIPSKSQQAVPEVASPQTAPGLQTVPIEPTDEALLKRFLAQREKNNQKTTAPSPINLTIAPDGSLVIASEDTAALDVLEELIRQTAPPLPDYKIYKLKYADAYWVMDNIEEYFEEDDDKKTGFNPFIFDFPPQQKSQARSRLSQRRKLKFIYDLDTNSILVQGANSRQLKTIEDLIEVYDQPEPANSQSARVSTMFPLRYSKASIVAAAIKDVYRDLLSSNDKALQSNNPEKKNRESREATFIFGPSSSGEPERTQVAFKGKLSIGIDDVSNTLLVSTEGENLMKIVGEMINTLDEAAKPLSDFSVVHLSGNVNAARVREVLATLLIEGPAAPSAPKSLNARQNGQSPQAGPAQENIQRAGSAVIYAP